MPQTDLPRESVVQKSILEYLAYRRVLAFRVNQQGIPMHANGRVTGFRPGPTRGVSDILGVLPGGRFLAIEVKRPGGKATEAQQEFLDEVTGSGGLAFVASSIDDVEERLRSL